MSRNRTRHPELQPAALSPAEKSRRHMAALEANIRTRKIGRKGEAYRRHVEVLLAELSLREVANAPRSALTAAMFHGAALTRHVTKGRLRAV